MSPLSRTIFDIETGGLPSKTILSIAPAFKESSVKVGNLGLDKALEKINHARDQHLSRIKDTAALNAEYGYVMAIGILAEDGTSAILHGEESNVLRQFWERADADDRKGLIQWVGFNCFAFDLPFLFRRSLINGVAVPPNLRPERRYWPNFFLDLMEIWKAGNFRDMISLDRFCKAAGLPGKSGDGASFQSLYETNQEDALAYLTNDLIITQRLADTVMPLLP